MADPRRDALSDALVDRARAFATAAHGIIDQRRKYTNAPYIEHPEEVASIVASVPHTPEMLAAAWLHDVVEDTPATIEDVREYFGGAVAELVDALTDASRPEDGNRATRKAIDREHIAGASREAKTVKLADLISNSASIVERDPGFARVYLQEKALLLEVLRDGDATLWERAAEIVRGQGYEVADLREMPNAFP